MFLASKRYFALHYLLLPLCFAFATTSFSQTTWEFSGTSYAFQKAHFDSATNVIKNKLGLQMHTFGAPYNQIDSTLIQVMSEDTSYKVLLFGQLSPQLASGQINLTNRVFIESATGVPDYNYFLTDYNAKKATYTDYMVMQGHPFAWTTETKLTEFQNILNHLIAEDVVFTTPYGYYQYLTDSSIPRTGKVQVILKLDDLRAASYFYPSLPTYDILVANKIKASFGVNKMETLTQSQIDTLNYYLAQTNTSGEKLFEIWNHGLDHSMTAATTGGNWSDPATWPSGYVPTSADDVEIPAGITVTIDDANAVCADLTVNGTLVALNTTAVSLTVNGDLLINTGGSFTSPTLTGGTSTIIHTLTVHGSFTNSGGTFDFRAGSAGTTMRVFNTTFAGNYNSNISVGVYSSTNNNFNGITINKTGGAKVTLGSDVFLDQGASTCVSQLNLMSGIVETGNYAIFALSTTTTDVIITTAPVTSYVVGALGRGMSNSVGKVNSFPIGDANGYRPISVRSTTGGTASGHYCLVRCIPSDANTGSSAFTGGIDTVSKKRHYRISYSKGIAAGAAASMGFSQFSPSYGTDDGVAAGNTDLRVAYSTDERATWNAMSQTTAHTTSLASPPTTITPAALTTAITLNANSGYIYAALAKIAGSSINPLPVELTTFTAVAIKNSVQLKWETDTEINSALFAIERACLISSVSAGKGNNSPVWETVATVAAAGNSNAAKEYMYPDRNGKPGKYGYRLRMIDNDGTFTYSNIIEVEVVLPLDYTLSQNYPNPFNPSTTIAYTLPVNGYLTLQVYSVTGQLVKTLVAGFQEAGYYTIGFSDFHLASGTYIYRLSANNRILTQKMLYLK
ncbi:MAG: T9SS type A sorting domain-containing protein [Ignavibacteriales bacterium]|nr:T9SS type A sorting domain-containing protein [Ignavibacteriales bacterium]